MSSLTTRIHAESRKDWRSKIVQLLLVLALALTGLTGLATPASAAIGNIRPPFDAGQQWAVCQGYGGSITHTGTYQYALDLTGAGCDSSASGRNVRAPISGTVYYYQASYGNLCINTTDGRSVTLTHINSSITSGNVSAGQLVGTVAAPGHRNNAGFSHLHLQMWSAPGCYENSNGGIPFDTAHGSRICGAPDLTATGGSSTGNGMWSGTTFTGEACGTTPSIVPNRNDFNGNGRDDILWYGAGSDPDTLWYGSDDRDAKFNKTYATSITVDGTFTPIAGDFDGDGRTDILWYGPGLAPDAMWYGSATPGQFVRSSADITVSGTYTPVVGDFNGNGRDDILWYGAGSDPDTLWYGSDDRDAKFNKTYATSITVRGVYVPAAGDFDGDGKVDILWYGVGSASDSMWYGSSTPGEFATSQNTISVSGQYAPIVGDFNGNGRDDILWYGAGSDPDTLWYGSDDRDAKFNKVYATSVVVNGTYTPIAGDFDGDSKVDILWYGPGSNPDAMWYGSATPGQFSTSHVSITITGTYTPV